MQNHVRDALCAGFPMAPRGAARNPTETRDWCTSAGQRRASLQEPCATLHAYYELENQQIYREFFGCVLVSLGPPRGARGRPAETRGWSTITGPRRASGQEPCADLLSSPPFQGEREGTQRKRETCAQVQVSAKLLCRNPALTCASDKLIFDLLY